RSILENHGHYAMKQCLGRLRGYFYLLAKLVDVVMVALLPFRQVGITGDLVQNGIELSGRLGDPLQVILMQHTRLCLVCVLRTCPQNATKNRNASESERTKSQHRADFSKVSPLHARTLSGVTAIFS